ncbi:Phosphatidylglycerophosphate synthase [Peptoclostridium litorale DSM 5388]|uniref:CDP-alcohol phosphatidyltransferase n=1 Tax=Peptoclostridium litorale DSM 5388 TaxID=1121324 RepID=A0A069RGV3_PEPLI|nr:CDP-alcohol phosphatidyltransferase family protein [Peptoclostridium litorale]KDR93978.1 CDP-alcohol phosphatidyltransferase [Peptoclostridium litorale DSM 5388]KDR95405.1 CDP-alcohol phosphatidyltransferase [Peptoclostridium litorale DSM 5388]SIN89715.1 Phosphatidylglycerophosphate synthase [Peptoclostridium litorale DSM 5388]
MLDTHARKYVDPAINAAASGFISAGFSPNSVTILAFFVGISSSILVFFDLPLLACLMLWISGYLDAVDGSMARMLKKSTPMGALLDMTFDRFVEIGIIMSLGIKFPDTRLILLFLSCSIIFSMCVFLTVGALSSQIKESKKSFYYQAGLAERTEGFILFSLMILFPSRVALIAALFAVLVVITGFQRLKEASRILN